MNGKQLTALLHNNTTAAERHHLPNLTRLYQAALAKAGDRAAEMFALTAAADWQPPAEGATLTLAEVAALAAALNTKLRPIWTRIVLDVARAPLARIEIAWDIKHPLAKGLLAQAGQRTGARLGGASQFILRKTIGDAYDQGLDIRATAALIRSAISEAAPWQADMLARSDLNSLANGSSKAAAQLAGMAYKTWDATLDAVTRPEHVEAHGQTVPMDGAFVVGGEECDYPGAPELSDAMACNCRCSVVFGDTLDEAGGLLADGGSTLMAMKTRQRKRKQSRRAASGKPTPIVKEALVASPRAIGFSGTAAVEGKISDDNSIAPRVLLPDSLNWPEMPVSFMAQTVTADAHEGAEVAGRVDEFARKRSTGRMRNIEFAGELTTPFGINEVAPMIDDETMRYVSADLGAAEWALVTRSTLEVVPEENFDMATAMDGGYALGLTSGKIKAVTLVPTQALEGAMVALTAAADEQGIGIMAQDDDVLILVPLDSLTLNGEALVAAATPRRPPREWFETPEPPGKMPLTVTSEGRVYGHLACWDSCHASFLPSCIPPPRSPSNYARFHCAELDTDDGDTVTVGKLMFSPSNGGHADRRLSPSKASAYYDKTGMAAAYLHVIDGTYGIWAVGAINPDLSDEQREEMRRQIRLNPPSGDWRPYDGQYDLLCGLCVAVPGFAIPRAEVSLVASGDEVELMDAIIASSGIIEPDPAALAALEQIGLVDDDLVAERQMHVLAARAEGLDSLAALVD